MSAPANKSPDQERALEELGAELRPALRQGLAQVDTEAQREGFMGAFERQQGANSRRPILRALAVAACVLPAIIIGVWLMPDEELTCTSAAGEPIAQGSWFDTQPSQSVELNFSDASQVKLGGKTRATLSEMSEEAVRVRLEEGSLRAAITPGGERTWRFEGGPFQVVVLGTELSIDWQPQDRSMRVAVHKGRVAVLGPTIRGGRVEVSAGESIRLQSKGNDRLERERSAAREESPEPEEPTADAQAGDPIEQAELVEAKVEEVEGASAKTREKRARGKARTRPRVARWRLKARAGDYRAAYQSAEARGLAGLRRKLSVDDLLLLADVERYSGHPEESVRTLERVRKRDRKGRRGEQASFRLARIELDQRKDDAAAARAFGDYLRDYPRGRFVEKARGLRMEALSRARQLERAREAARLYLRHHPDGVYKKSAERLLRGN